MDWQVSLDRHGFAVVRDVLDTDTLDGIVRAVERARGERVAGGGRKPYAIRNLLEAVPAVAELVQDLRIGFFPAALLGDDWFGARSILFDKIPGANWKVAWHQDLSIPVRRRKEVAGFGPWSIKAGVVHVQPPIGILEKMVTIRMHLDDCDQDNGPLRVLPGSHRAERLDAAGILEWQCTRQPVECIVPRGGIVLMRPLLLHASSAARRPGHRRVIHFECASGLLSDGLEWAREGALGSALR